MRYLKHSILVACLSLTPLFAQAQTWVQVSAGVSFLDTKLDSVVQRGSLGLDLGVRKNSFGVFAHLERQNSIESTAGRSNSSFMQIGPGFEFVHGQIRSAVSAGVLTQIEGWYVDARPISLRFPLKSGTVLEFTPLSIDISEPKDKGSMYSNFTMISIEWARNENAFNGFRGRAFTFSDSRNTRAHVRR